MSGLAGMTALVTGAASGIGRATALAFAAEGSKVVVSDVSGEGGRETVELISHAGGEAIFVEADVSRAAEVAAMVNKAISEFGSLDCAVNNAGIEGTLADTISYPEDVWDRLISINLKGVWLCMKYEIPQMLKQQGGTIVNMSSILGKVAFANASAYTAAKHGVIGITKVAALEYATQGIRVNAVCPGIIETPMVMDRSLAARQHPEVYKQLAGLHPVERMGKPGEVAAAVVWLCSEESSFVTGHSLVVDGGYVAR